MKLISKIFWVAGVIVIILLAWYMLGAIRGCQDKVSEIISPGRRASVGREDPLWGKPREMEIKQPLVGTEEKPTIEIVIPPSDDTTRLRIPGGETVYGLPADANIQITKYQPPVIRLRPTFHITGLTDFSQIYFGLKIRVVEVWRFGLCGYIAICGPGVGCDFRVISNVSIGGVRTLNKWFVEVSVKL
ncbi:MAG: hypothetical protein WBB37_07565 [bacterium]